MTNKEREERVQQIQARCDAAQPAPWRWEVTTKHKNVSLENGRYVVMSFARYGMSGAAPCFLRNGRLTRVDELTKSIPGYEHHVGFDDYIDHPDAQLLSHARGDLDFLLEERARLKRIIAELEARSDSGNIAQYADAGGLAPAT